MSSLPEPIAQFQVDSLAVRVYETRAAMGVAAAHRTAVWLRQQQEGGAVVPAVFAAAPARNELLANLAAAEGVDWSRVLAFHMDEYLGISPDHPASFRRYLREHLFDRVALPAGNLHLIPGEAAERPLRTCLDYEDKLRANPPRLVCAGIGENGHLAFNDPPVADFLDPVAIKVVRLDHECRVQQVNDGCFATLEDVPTHAFTLTIPALLARAVPDGGRARPAQGGGGATLRGPIGEACPATALRGHAGAMLFLDRESAKHVL